MSGRTVRFILICEGSSDKALVEHLQDLLIHCGAIEAIGAAVDRPSIKSSRNRSISAIGEKVRALLSIDSEYDLLFVHRDSDGADYNTRHAEVEKAMVEAEAAPSWVPAIPVRETEAWLLLDETAIRRVAGNPNGRVPLNLPTPARVENVLHPKEVLREALSAASGRQGNRLRKFNRNFRQHRRVLLEQLPVGGDLERVPAWRRLKRAVEDFLSSPP